MKTEKLNVAIGPLSWVGGVKTHILNIQKFSSHNIFPINYSKLSLYFPKYKGIGPFIIRHQIPIVDPYGLYLSKYKLPQNDIVHTHGHIYWQDIYRRPEKSAAKYIHTVHQVYFEDESRRKEWKIRERQNKLMFDYCRNPDVNTVTVSDFVKEILLDQGINAEVIPNGVDFQEIKIGNSNRFRTNYNIKEEFFLFIGHMGFIKRPDLFIELANKIPDKKFVMIGPDITEKNILLNYGMKLPENVILLGKIPRASVIDALKACKVYIHPSIREAFSITLLESFACKKPTVSTNSGGIKEFINKNVPLNLFEQNNFDDLYEKACYAWDHVENVDHVNQIIKKEYDWNAIIKRIDNLYERVMQ